VTFIFKFLFGKCQISDTIFCAKLTLRITFQKPTKTFQMHVLREIYIYIYL